MSQTPHATADLLKLNAAQYEKYVLYRSANLTELGKMGLSYPARVWRQLMAQV